MNLVISMALILINLIILTASLIMYIVCRLWYLIPISIISSISIFYYLSAIKKDIESFNKD